MNLYYNADTLTIPNIFLIRNQIFFSYCCTYKIRYINEIFNLFDSFLGQISNANHYKEHIGSPNRNRELGNRPRSGLWQRKTGRFGRKIRPPPPLKIIDGLKAKRPKQVILELSCHF